MKQAKEQGFPNISHLRERLLDLSGKNNAIQYRHSPRSTRQIRVVNENGNALFRKLVSGEALGFMPVPEPTLQLPDDEKSPEFSDALAHLVNTSTEYKSKFAKLEKEGAWRAIRSLELEYRDRLRAQLGLAPIDRRKGIAAETIAESSGINPSFDLNFADPSPDFQKTDNAIQTLYYQSDLELRLRSIAKLSQQWRNEIGIDTLYCVFGFLDWYEAADTDKPLRSPLLLLPVEIKESADKQLEFKISARDDEVQTNISLQKRLFNQFGLKLPSISEDDTPASYLSKVQEIIKGQNDWKIQSFITLGFFFFAKTAMYDDLSPEAWQDKHSPGFDLLNTLLTGASGETSAPTEKMAEMSLDLEDLPPVVSSTDSSQMKAILQATKGRNLVIEGPPGTGKSQTITNLIASLLSQDKSVLFVAEKHAALKVVKDRLDDCGLGEYCLELHSDKTNRSSFLSSIKNRLDHTSKLRLSAVEKNEQRLKKTAADLREYYLALLSPVAQTPVQLHQLFWKILKFKQELGQAVKNLEVPGEPAGEVLDEERLNRQIQLLDEYEEKLRQANVEKITEHPWWGLIPNEEVDPARALDDTEAAIKSLGLVLSSHPLLETLMEESSEALKNLLDKIHAEVSVQPDQAGEVWNLRTQENLERASAFAFALNELKKTEEEIKKHFNEAAADFDGSTSEKIKLAFSHAKELGFSGDTSALQRHVNLLRGDLATFEEMLGAIDIIPEVINRTLLKHSELVYFFIACGLVKQLPKSLWTKRKSNLYSEELLTPLTKALEHQQKLNETLTLIKEHVDLEQTLDLKALKKQVNLLARKRSIARYLSPSYWRAKNSTKKYLLTDNLKHHEKIEVLRHYVEFLEEKSLFLQLLPEIESIVRPGLSILELPLAETILLINWQRAIKEQLPITTAINRQLREILFTGTQDVLERLYEVARVAELPWQSKLGLEGENPSLTLNEIHEKKKQNVLAHEHLLKELKSLNLSSTTPLTELEHIKKMGATLLRQRDRINSSDLKSILPKTFNGHKTDFARLENLVAYVELLKQSSAPSVLLEALFSSAGPKIWSHLSSIKSELQNCLEKIETAFSQFSTPEEQKELAQNALLFQIPFKEILSRINRARTSAHLKQLKLLMEDLAQLQQYGAAAPVFRLSKRSQSLRALSQCHAFMVFSDLLKRSEVNIHQLPPGLTLEKWRQEFKELDEKYLQYNRAKIDYDLSRKEMLPGNRVGRVDDLTEASLILHYADKGKMKLSIRQYIQRASKSLMALKPCFMMSPLAVSKYLVPGVTHFDVVVIDEASQILPEDALGAILRGTQVIVVGDPKQLPPTNFFSFEQEEPLQLAQDTELENPDGGLDSESILEWAMESFRPSVRLLWHYRSRHQSLIEFSNRHFYDDRLIIPPSPVFSSGFMGVQYEYVGGLYKAGKNLQEAERVVDRAVELMISNPEKNMLIVTMNVEQRDLIDQVFSKKTQGNQSVTDYLNRWKESLYPFDIKNLESVQGDERDIILVSTLYGRALQDNGEAGPVFQRFGPVGGKYGHRRLNVLFTRAKYTTILITSLKSSDIQIKSDSHLGPQILKNYLAYAEAGGKFLSPEESEKTNSSMGDLEFLICSLLQKHGY